MANENIVTLHGRLTNDPEPFTFNDGTTVVNFSIANTERRRNKQSQQYEDFGDTMFVSCKAFRDLGQHVLKSLHKGDLVLVHGNLYVRRWQSNGKSGTSIEMTVDDVAASLKYDVISIDRTAREQRRQQNQQGYDNQQSQSSYGQQPAADGVQDPWSQTPANDNYSGQEPEF